MFQDIIRIFGANIVKMLVSLVITFLVPKLLTIEGFGHYKLFSFYCSYLGLITFGFCDGIYLKYGGFELNKINKSVLEAEHSTFFIYELTVSLIIFISGIVLNDFEICMIGLIVLPLHMYSFHSFFFQATGQLSQYSQKLTISNFVNLFFYAILIFFNVEEYQYYIFAIILGNYVLFLLFIIPFLSSGYKLQCSFHFDLFYQTCKLGLLLMIGNIMSELFLGIDKWFIKFTLPISAFSYYSFAGQIIRAVNMIVTPISMTLYSYICKERSVQFEKSLLERLLLLVTLVPLISYIAEIIIYRFLPKYIPAIPVLEVLMLSQMFWSINAAIFVNLFKAYKKQKKYFSNILLSLFIASILHLIVAVYKPSILVYSLVTLFTSMMWLFINYNSFTHLCLSWNNYAYVILLLLLTFIIWECTLPVKTLSYLLAYIFLTATLKRKDAISCAQSCFRIILRR